MSASSPFAYSPGDNDGYSMRIAKPWGWELHWTPVNLPYFGKVLHIDEGKRLSLQVHDVKLESWFLASGRAAVIWDDFAGELAVQELEPGKGYTCQPGHRHRLVGLTTCEIVEVSTPEGGTTWRLDDDYGRPNETKELRARERQSQLLRPAREHRHTRKPSSSVVALSKITRPLPD
jgi:mannose-6-phosphate isomerase-like protein (cupin superfamily)